MMQEQPIPQHSCSWQNLIGKSTSCVSRSARVVIINALVWPFGWAILASVSRYQQDSAFCESRYMDNGARHFWFLTLLPFFSTNLLPDPIPSTCAGCSKIQHMGREGRRIVPVFSKYRVWQTIAE